ncbi:MAG TPA: phosphate signaling complex protein PhoU [Bacillota bacterium]|nr:phosphate signaling complex protein PhoU [Bacillota bacterium]HPT87061.1 phosphate signaling complex protein PhoU [Bacillota bacterium]
MFGRMNAYDRAIVNIRDRVLAISEQVDRQLHLAMRSFIEKDETLALTVINADDAIDQADSQLELDALELISIQQPVVQDLRRLAAAMRISRELERIGDYACDIAEIMLRLKMKTEWFKSLTDVPRMAERVQIMLKKSLSAYRDLNLTAAWELDTDDQEIDRLYLELYDELTRYVQNNPDAVEQAFGILLVVRYLERIADHGVNIAEMVIFIETGERHPFKRKVEPSS